MRVLVVLTFALLPLSLLQSNSSNRYEFSSNAHEQPNDGTADGLTEEVIKHKREELLTHLLEGLEEGARTKTEFLDPLEAVNYAKEQELRREKESFRSGNRRVRRSVPKFKPPSPYAIINDSEDGKKPDNFLLETLPQNLLEVKQGTYIHFRICPKPVVPEEVNTDRKLHFPFTNCDDIEAGRRVLLDDTELPFPWLYGKFLEGDFLVIKMGGKVVLRYSPRSRHLIHYLTDASAYSHRTNRSVIVSLLVDRQLINQPTEVLVESQSTVVAQPVGRRINRPDGESGYFVEEPVRGRPKWPGYFNLTVNTLAQASSTTLETDSSAPRILFNDLAVSGGLSDSDWLAPRSGQTVSGEDFDVSEDSPISPVQVIATMRQLRANAHHWTHSPKPGDEETYSLQPRIRRFSPVLVVEVGELVSLHCVTTLPGKDLRIWHTLGAFHTQQQHLHRLGTNVSSLDAVLRALRPTLAWRKDTFVRTNDIYVTDETVLSRVTCGGQGVEARSLYFVVLSSSEYAAFMRWGAYSMRTGKTRVPLRREPKLGGLDGQKGRQMDQEDIYLIVAAVLCVVVPGALVLLACRVFRRRRQQQPQSESIAIPSHSDRVEYGAALRNVEQRLRGLQTRLAASRESVKSAAAVTKGGGGDMRSAGDIGESKMSSTSSGESSRHVSA